MGRRRDAVAGAPVDLTPVDLAPVLAPDPLDLRVTLASIVHWADSRDVRVRVMRSVEFPVDDLAMFLVVNQLAHRGALRPTDLSVALGTGKANLSKIARRLEQAGLVVRVPSAADERSVLLSLTEAGRAIGVRIMEHLQQTMDAVLADWPAEEVAALRRVLARLARDAIEDPGGAGPRISRPG